MEIVLRVPFGSIGFNNGNKTELVEEDLFIPTGLALSGDKKCVKRYIDQLLLLLLLRKFIERRIARWPQVRCVSSGNCQLFKCQLSTYIQLQLCSKSLNGNSLIISGKSRLISAVSCFLQQYLSGRPICQVVEELI